MERNSRTKRHYCTVCSNYRGKTIADRRVTLHRFPASDKIRNAWIRRLKLIKKNYKFNDTQRLCSEHFVDGVFSKNAVPSVFGQRVFKTSTIDEIPPVQETKSPIPLLVEDYSDGGSSNPESMGLHTSRTDASVFFHDYCGSIKQDSISRFLDKCEQTDVLHVKTTSTVATQTDAVVMTSSETQTDLEEGKHKHEAVLVDAGVQCTRPILTYESLESDQKFMFYTGVPSKPVFEALFSEMEDAESHTARKGTSLEKGRPRTLRLIDEFFLVLMRLRLGLLLEDIADRFCISKSTCGVICDRWITYLHHKLAFLTVWPSKDLINKHMPQKFKRKYPNCRVIIDCTELFTETPKSLANKTLLYSHYKSHMTYKGLVGISPGGLITFASDLWSGAISDKQITKKCGILDLCEPGDAIMADKGFLITDLTTPRGIQMIIPPLKTKRFSRREVEETRRIANLRIDVERAMERIKNFRILRGDIPITLAHCVSKVWQICVNLANLQPPLVQEDVTSMLAA